MSRQVIFDNSDGYDEFSFGNYALLYFYAHKIDATKAQELFKVIIPEISYRQRNSLDLNGLQWDVDYDIYYDAARLQAVLDFINNDIIPGLIAKDEDDILEEYGGESAIEDYINSNLELGVSNEGYDPEAYMLLNSFEILKTYLTKAISSGQPYKVII